MIPKIINYCWFGGAEKPDSVKRCIDSWRNMCPEYQIIEWNEANFDVNFCDYCRQAHEMKMWAFVSDAARLKIIYDNGGIYLDTDVELVKSLDSLCLLEAFAGFQDNDLVATGLGFGAIKGHPVIKMLLDAYTNRPFKLEGGIFDRTPCPDVDTRTLLDIGLKRDGTLQELKGLTILPSEYLCPIDFKTGEFVMTENTISIHHFDGTWYGLAEKIKRAVKSIVPVSLLKWLRSRI